MPQKSFHLKVSRPLGHEAYLYLPERLREGREAIDRQVWIAELIPGYSGFPLYADITKDNLLIGIEISTDKAVYELHPPPGRQARKIRYKLLRPRVRDGIPFVYLQLPVYADRSMRVEPVQQISFYDIYPLYTGSTAVYFDIDKDNIIFGIKAMEL